MAIGRLLVANRSEIAIRIFRAAAEMGIETVALYAAQDRLSLHRFKADKAFQVGAGLAPIEAYLCIDEVMRVALEAGADAVHPGYGFLSENPQLAEACAAAGIAFIGPSAETLRQLGDKVTARRLAERADVPVVPATAALPHDEAEIGRLAAEIGYPLMLKASWGGGGRGMRPILDPKELIPSVMSARREARAAFGRDEVYLEKLVRRARHVEIQVLGDRHGNLLHLYERDCSIQRRRQKIVERAPAAFLAPQTRDAMCEAALRISRAAHYEGAGTVEFLLNEDDGAFYFIEVNPRIQVEHTVTEMVTGIDIVKAQIRIAEGGRLGIVAETGVPPQAEIRLDGHALQCRITTEDPENNFIPDYGRIVAHRAPSGFGIRIDGGTAYAGAVVTPFYDPLLEKLTAWGRSPEECVARSQRALREYRIRGLATNVSFLDALLSHPRFRDMSYTTTFVDETPELLRYPRKRDRGTKLLSYIAGVTVNGHPETRGRPRPRDVRVPSLPVTPIHPASEPAKAVFDRVGAEGLSQWMLAQSRPLVTDTTMRDAHQSLLATRMRTFDIVRPAQAYANGLPDLFSLECWGGATFDVAMRFLDEDPWERLTELRRRTPHALLQMLLRGANGVGYTNYPDNVVRYFIQQAADAGVDIFRIFDCFNWVENMRVAIDAVGAAGKIAEGAICYTGDLLDPSREKYALDYYLGLAQALERAGCHVIAIKDMAGLLKPRAARRLVTALKETVGLPIQLHTHDTSGIAAATVLAAVDAGVDAFDAAMDAMSGGVSQPCLGSLVEALRGGPRDTRLDPTAIRAISEYWEKVRAQYAAFEGDMRAGASEVYLHELPGGQFTNLREQARALGLADRWHEVARAYRAANDLFGDIVKVTPSSKVVGDMALMMVSQGLSADDVLNPARQIAFPQSVTEMLRGELGRPPGGWPPAIQNRVLKGAAELSDRPGALLPPVDLAKLRTESATACRRDIDDREFASALMYPKVFLNFSRASQAQGPVSALPTPIYFYGMAAGDEVEVEIEPGKTLLIQLLAVGTPDGEGMVSVFFELNGQPRQIKLRQDSAKAPQRRRLKADPSNPAHVAAPMPGIVSSLSVAPGQRIEAGAILLSIEAMKVETQLTAPSAATVGEVTVQIGATVEAKDLLLTLEPVAGAGEG
ncbi:MAG TPA: pyruvate carboxylase [Phenylobacterium sp.]|jgi:pyruvate carboxylase|uniref:pyruvate carboxylase n=1 Tax=Phenylobacterium sp. TaxID=1871053 RepID=UPI002D1CA8A8|nr:pyruvate carboxylase [Phenylobacterium sp.]HXA37493.1 pyruvate carboxylase [Phenylobacterium sp.]